MKIELLTPYQKIVSDSAEEVYAVGPKGEFGILPGHAHYVTPLQIGRLYYRHQGKAVSFIVEGGFLEVFQETVFVFADKVERAGEITPAQAKQHLEEIEKQLGQGGLEGEPFQHLLQQQTRAQARLVAVTEKL
jgi:F-type H+-transporting ATPase subunit epsilon